MNIPTTFRTRPAFIRFEGLEHYATQATTTRHVEEILQVFRKDENSIVRHEAAAQLIRLKREKPHLFTPRLDRLVRCALRDALYDKSVVLVHEALEALAYFGNARTRRTLSDFTRHSNVDIRCSAEHALALLEFRLKRRLQASELLGALFAK